MKHIKHRHHDSMGQVIVTFTFLAVGGFLTFAALIELNSIKAFSLWVCAISTLIGAARFFIHDVVNWILKNIPKR